MTLSVPIAPEVEAKLYERARAAGRDPVEYAAELIRECVMGPTLDEILAPIHSAFTASGMSDDELAEFLECEKHAMRAEQAAIGKRS